LGAPMLTQSRPSHRHRPPGRKTNKKPEKMDHQKNPMIPTAIHTVEILGAHHSNAPRYRGKLDVITDIRGGI
jgi:hypothetical protein